MSSVHPSLRLALRALHVLAAVASGAFKSRTALHLEDLAPQHQLGVLHRSAKRPKLTSADSTPLGVAVVEDDALLLDVHAPLQERLDLAST